VRNLVEAVLIKKAEKIRRYPCQSNRASSLGYFVPLLEGCLRRGVYERTRWQEKEMHDARVQCIFDEGHNQEQAVLRDLSDAGIPIVEQQTPFEWKEKQITGTVDGKYIEDGIAYPIEFKSMAPHIFAVINSFEDFKKKSWTRTYMAQITIYMLLQGIDKAIFILKNKSTGELKQITFDLDYELGEACIRTAEIINDHIAKSTLPDRIKDVQVCKQCPYKLICLPEIDFGVELKINDDPIFEHRINQYLRLKTDKEECEELYEIIRKESRAQAGESGDLNMVVGKYRLTGKLDSRKAFRLDIETI
jgi:CRISPR/Cas system-associated exonuclease Cas4 (RecB family)